MDLEFFFWIRSSDLLPIYQVYRKDKTFHLYLHYIDQDMASWGNDNFSLTYLGNHGICEMLLEQQNIPPIVHIAEEAQDLYEIRSLS